MTEKGSMTDDAWDKVVVPHLINQACLIRQKRGKPEQWILLVMVLACIITPQVRYRTSRSKDKSHPYAITYIPCIATSGCGSLKTSQNIFQRRS